MAGRRSPPVRSRPNVAYVRIEDLPPDRCDDATSLWRTAGLTRPWNDPRGDFQRALAGPTSTVLGGLTPDGGLLGTLMVSHDVHRGWVYYLAVHPDEQGRGVGRRLMAVSERWLQARGVPKINLMVRKTKGEAIGFYTRARLRRRRSSRPWQVPRHLTP